jgi:hypothetical protein
MSPAVKAYEDEIVNGALASCLAKSKEIGGIVEQHVSHSFVPAVIVCTVIFRGMDS